MSQDFVEKMDDDNNENKDVELCKNENDMKLHEAYMRIALKVAQSALDEGEVPVGCIIVLRDIHSINFIKKECMGDNVNQYNSSYITSPSVIVSYGSNMVNATRDATRHAEMIAIDRMLTNSSASDQLRLSPDVIAMNKNVTKDDDDISKLANESSDADCISHQFSISPERFNIKFNPCHWKNEFGWNAKDIFSNKTFDADIFPHCDLYVTCEPCIMVSDASVCLDKFNHMAASNKKVELNFYNLWLYHKVCCCTFSCKNWTSFFWLFQRSIWRMWLFTEFAFTIIYTQKRNI